MDDREWYWRGEEHGATLLDEVERFQRRFVRFTNEHQSKATRPLDGARPRDRRSEHDAVYPAGIRRTRVRQVSAA
jgi:hypothetical protein